MINRHAKGVRYEREFELILQERGYKTFKPTWNKFNKNKDVFNLFDILAISSKELLMVQVKSNYCPKQVKEQLRDFKVPKNIVKLLAVKIDRKGWTEEVIK